MVAIEIAQIGAEIVRKAIDLHKKGIDTDAIRVAHETITAIHAVIHEHWEQHQDDT